MKLTQQDNRMQKILIFITLLISLLTTSCDIENGTPSDAITIISSTQIEVGRYAGEFTISYISDTTPEISLSSDWLRIKSNKSGLATILFDTNQTGGMRQAAVVLSNKTSKATVVVTQSNESVTPQIRLVNESDIELDRCGQLLEIKYTIENTNPVDYVYAKTSAEWIYSIECKKNSNTIELGVATNTTNKERKTTVTIGYGSATVDVNILQAGDGDINFKARTLWGDYYGDAATPGAGNYWFVLSDRGFNSDGSSQANTTYYRIDAYGPVATTIGTMPIPNGTYTYDSSNSCSQWTFTAEYSGYWVTDVNARRNEIIKFEEATLVVQGDKITLSATINGEQHNVSYEGENILLDCQKDVTILSTLEGDYEADLSNHYMVYECYGDFYDYGAYNWMFVIRPNNNSGDCFQLDIITGHNNKESGFAGNYIASDLLKTWSFIPGWTDQQNLQCSWFHTTDLNLIAPFRGGEVSVRDNGDGTMTVDIDITDDRRNRITGSWTGSAEQFVEQSMVFNK